MFRNPATDLIVVLVIVLLILGPKRLPGLGKGLGQGMREFKEGITHGGKDEDEERAEITPGASTPASATPPVSAAPPAAAPAVPAPDPAPTAGGEQTPTADRGAAEVGSERNS